MADDNDNVTFKLDLDVKDAAQSVLQLTDQISSIGDAKNLEGLISGLTQASSLIGVLGAGILAIGVSIESVFEAEQIKQVNNQFETMSKNLGLVSTDLKESLLTATRGFADETDVLKAANAAMVQLGGSSNHIPEIMELARKSTAVFGGDAIERFDQLSNAIASGNTRILKHMGLIIDTDKANKDYAKSLGITVSELIDADKRQAVLNAVLEKGKDAFKGIDENTTQATDSWKQAKAAFKDLGEAIALIIDKTIGPAIRSVITLFRDFAVGFKDTVISIAGDGSEKTAAKVRLLTGEQVGLKKAMDDLDKSGQTFYNGTWVTKGSVFADQMEKHLEQVNAQLKKTTAIAEQESDKQKKALSGGNTDTEQTGGNKEKIAADEAKFQLEILKIKEDALHQQMKIADTMSAYEHDRLALREIDEAQNQEKINQIKSTEALNESQKIQMIEAENAAHRERMAVFDIETIQNKQAMIEKEKQMSFDLDQYDALLRQQKLNEEKQFQMQMTLIKQMEFNTDAERMAAVEEAERSHQERLVQIDSEATRQREQVINNWAASGTNAADKFYRGFVSGMKNSELELMNFEKLGKMAFRTFSSHATNAFIELGEGSKKGSDIMREAFFGMLSDMAIQLGTYALMAGIVQLNPAIAAAGAGLLILGGMLKGMANGNTSTSGGGVSGGGGDIGGGGFNTSNAATSVDQNQQQRKTVTVQVQGDYFETEQTRTRLLDMIREGTDATDFKYVQIGQT